MRIVYEFDPFAAPAFQWHAFAPDFCVNEVTVAYASTKHHAGFQLRRILGAPEEEEEQDEASP